MDETTSMLWVSSRMLVVSAGVRAAGLARALRKAKLRHVTDVVATLEQVAIVCEIALTDDAASDVERAVREVDASVSESDVRGREIVVPVCYEREFGVDIDDVARERGLSREDVIALHVGRTYRAGFVGFAPGFSYLQGVDERLQVARLASPRARVEAGSVAIAGSQTAVYPSATPGGWRVVGRTPMRMFDARRERAAMIEAGDVVRFEAISRERYEGMKDEIEQLDAASVEGARSGAREREASLRVIHPGTFASVQDVGRAGWMHAGVARSGAADRVSGKIANWLVGNDDDAAVIEATMSGPTLLAIRDVTIAMCGADAAAVIEQASGRMVEMPSERAVTLQAGEMLRVRGYRAGTRLYIAVAGGAEVEPVMGSRATHVASGVGGCVLRAGDELMVGDATRAARDVTRTALSTFVRDCAARRVLRVTMHPQSRLLGADAVEKFFAGLWQVTRRGDRVGVRLEGARMAHAVGVMASHVTLPGDIEVTPDGGAVVLGPDGPVTGGYPVIASVIDADLPSMMQARSGEWVRFAPVSMSEARAAVREQAERMKTLLAGGGA